jgi:peptide/nickel transport system permease protein
MTFPLIGNVFGFFKRLKDTDLWKDFLASRSAKIGSTILIVTVFAAISAPLITPQNPYDLSVINILDAYKPPFFVDGGEPRFVLGTDEQGRDVLSAVVYGLRTSIFVGIMGVLISAVLGVILGLVGGYFGGSLDALIMRVADIELSFPSILVALFIMYFWEPGIRNIIVAIVAVEWVLYARTARGSVLTEKEKDYVEAAHAIGVKRGKIIFRHLLPNILAPIIVIANVRFSWVIILEASLSFLGAGVPAEKPSLGTLILNGYQVLFSGLWWTSVFPGFALVLLVMGVNLLGDWMRDALNPRLRR